MTEITWKECKNKVLRMLLVQLSAYALLIAAAAVTLYLRRYWIGGMPNDFLKHLRHSRSPMLADSAMSRSSRFSLKCSCI